MSSTGPGIALCIDKNLWRFAKMSIEEQEKIDWGDEAVTAEDTHKIPGRFVFRKIIYVLVRFFSFDIC